MAKMNFDYYKMKDLYSDGDIEDTILYMVRNGIDFEELPGRQVEFPMIYHLSQVRENILAWYPFGEHCRILEIGAGCGAITGLLCRKAERVVAVELSKRRAQINFERNKSYENLEIMVGNLNEMEFHESFDYVVLNGVLEYAMSFTRGEQPYHSFLKKMGDFLAPGGRLLVAIENRLGLKYFAGAPEDHTDLYFLGIDRYRDNHTVRTFSKTELLQLLEESGFPFCHVYYPYPDYKFPTEIFTDETLISGGYGKSYPVYTENYLQLFQEETCARSLMKEGVMDTFVNSFLVDAGKEELIRDREILYVKLNQERSSRFRLMTSIVRENGEMAVEKSVLHPDAVPFLKSIAERSQMVTGSYQYLTAEYCGQTMRYPFLKGKTYQRLIKDYVDREDREGIFQLLDGLFSEVFAGSSISSDYHGDAFREVFGSCKGKEEYPCIAPANIDLICQNIFVEADVNMVIDYEWVFSFAVPVPFIIWRTLHELYTRIPKLAQLCTIQQLFERYGIQRSDNEVFFQWTKHFVYQYVGCDKMDAFRKKRIQLPLEQLAGRVNARHRLGAKLYYDLGTGLGEEQTLEQSCQVERKRFRFHFNFRDISGITGIRWDFLAECDSCMIRIDRIRCNVRIGLRPMDHFVSQGGFWLFMTREPMFFVDCWDAGEIREITVEGCFEPLTRKYIRNLLQDQLEKKESLEKEIAELKNREQALLAQKKEETLPGKKERLKHAVKKVLGKAGIVETVSKKPEITCIGSVDLFQIKEQVVSVAGWAFDPVHEMNALKIVFYDGDKPVLENEYQMIFRKDVAENIHRPEAEASGFALNASVVTPRELQVYLEYGTQDGKGRMFLGSIPCNTKETALPEPEITVFADPNSLGDIRSFLERRVTEPGGYPVALTSQMYDVIVPVYNGMQFLPKLFASLERTRLSYRLILIDDHSPDERVKEYLEQYASGHDHVVLIRNEENLGFVRSVNKGLEMAEHHLALVNTDVEVPEEWLERLMLPIATEDRVATATPFTTCGTICSFPDFCKDNELLEGMEVWQIDNVFRKIRPQYPAMPTGVGFCMGMNLEAVRQIGVLDAETFGKGYGEENDWCRRAVKAGYRNVLVDNLFVYHKHGGSFLSQEKVKLLEHNLVELDRKHPEYRKETADFCRRDPARPIRLFALFCLLNQVLEKKTYLAFDHSLGGGATEYLNSKVEEVLKAGQCFVTVRYNIYENKYHLIYQYKKYYIEYFSEDMDRVLDLLPRIDEIWINELVTFPDIYRVQKKIMKYKQKHCAYLKMLLHDFFALCPAVNLMNDKGEYCEAAAAGICNQCIPANKSNACLDYESGDRWREMWNQFLQDCDEITAFSNDSAALLKKVYPEVYGVRVIPHTPHYLPPLGKNTKTTDTLNIGLLGVLCYKKGLEVVKELVREIEKTHRKIRICLLGESDEPIDSPVFTQTGRYTRETLPRLTMEQDIDIFLIPSIWPETYSYTASEIMSMEMPIAVFPIGAPVERVKEYEKGLIVEHTTPGEILDHISRFAFENCGVKKMPVDHRRILFISQEISFASRYRVEHLREQLLFKGTASDFIQIQETENRKFDSYTAVVFYRCSETALVAEAVEKARKCQCAVYYDIDDLIFDYDRISHLHFLEGEEYRDFRKTTEQIHTCMELCDGYLTSTETLAEQIRKEFPGKPVVVNRNSFSMEMQVLSHDAKKGVDERDRIYIGYFSGSKTHDRDFALVEDALLEIMEKYPNVYLKLVGVLSEDKMKRMQHRIVKLPFMEWQKLPQQIAEVDINLMPLEDSLFHSSKSENKWMEAALVKVPSVISRNREMELVIENGRTGFLCTEKQEWLDALDRLVSDEEFRKQMGEQAFEKVWSQYATRNTGEEARELILGDRN